MSQSPSKLTIQKQLLGLPIIQKLVTFKTNAQLHKLSHLLQNNINQTKNHNKDSTQNTNTSLLTPKLITSEINQNHNQKSSSNRSRRLQQKIQIYLPTGGYQMIFFISGKMEIFRKKKDAPSRLGGTNRLSKQLNISKQIQSILEDPTIVHDQQFHQFPELTLQTQKQQQLEQAIIDQPGHYFLEPNPQKILINNPTIFYTLNQKHTIQIFEPILPLPFIQARMKQLKNIELFNNMEKKKIVKIAGSVQEKFLFIGNKIQTEVFQDQNGKKCVQRYCYYIVEGQIVIFRDGIAVSVLGPRQIFGAPTKLKQQTLQSPQQIQKITHEINYKLKGSIGKVRTSTAHIYQIPAQLLLQNNQKINQYVNQRIKWRENRVIRITKLTQKEKEKRDVKMREKASFIDKQIVFKSFYGKSIEHLQKMKHYCTNDQLKCQSREEFYGKKLDSIKMMQKKRYGQNKTIVLFPIPLSRYITNMAKTVGISPSPQQKQRQNEKNSLSKRRYSQNKRNKTQSSNFGKCQTPNRFNRTNGNFFTTHI